MKENSKLTTADLITIRQQFPVLHQKVNGKPLVYLDNAATTQKPKRVIDKLTEYYQLHNANIHRGAHTLADRATGMFEHTREVVRDFIHAGETAECIFTKGVTESINLVAHAWGRKFLKQGDEILLSMLEHHSNIVPWQMVAEETGAIIRVVPILADGSLDMIAFEQLCSERTKLVAITWASNALGTVNPVETIIQKAHKVGALVLLDGAQAGSHLPINVQELDVDFLALSSHKLYGPTGVGVLYGKRILLEDMNPYQGGGEMIREVSFSGTTYNDIPFKFEAGTPNIADVIAFSEALAFVNEIGKPVIMQWESQLLDRFVGGIQNLEGTDAQSGIHLFGTAKEKVAVQSFLVGNQHPFDTGLMLDAKGIAVRTGHHCTQPLMHHFQVEGTVRASFAIYNTEEEVDILLDAIGQLLKKGI